MIVLLVPYTPFKAQCNCVEYVTSNAYYRVQNFVSFCTSLVLYLPNCTLCCVYPFYDMYPYGRDVCTQLHAVPVITWLVLSDGGWVNSSLCSVNGCMASWR